MDLAAHGLSCSLGTGWSGEITKHDDGSGDVFAPALQATTSTLSARCDGPAGADTATRLTPQQVLVTLSEYYPDAIVIPAGGIFESTVPPWPLSLTDFSGHSLIYGDNPASDTLVGTQKFCTINGRPFGLVAVLGAPTQSLLNAVNAVMSTIVVQPSADPYREEVMRTPGLVSFWRLGELSGIAGDETGQNPGNYTGPYTQGQAALITGSGNTAVAFAGNPGSGGAIVVPGSPSLSLPSGFTLETWFKPSSMTPAGNKHTFFNKTPFRFGVTSTGVVELTVKPAVGPELTVSSSPGLVSAHQVYHVVAVLGGAAFGSHGVPCYLYLNGEEVAAGTVGVPLQSSSGQLIIGGYFNNFVGFTQGILDEVGIYNVPLSVDDVRVHFSLGSGQVPGVDQYKEVVSASPGLRGYWRLNENNGPVCRDSAETNHGTKAGAWVPASPLVGNSPDRALTMNTGTVTCSGTAVALTKPMSVETWVGFYQLPPSGQLPFLSHPNGAFSLKVGADGALRFELSYGSQGTHAAVSAPGAVSLNTIYHVVGTYDGSALRVYRNGVEVASSWWTGELPGGSTSDIVISHSGLRGGYDEVAIYASALTFAEVDEHYRIGAGGTLDDPPPPPASQPPSPPPDPGPEEPAYYEGTGAELGPEEA